MSEIRETKGCEMPEFISSEMKDLRSRVESLLVDLEELESLTLTTAIVAWQQ